MSALCDAVPRPATLQRARLCVVALFFVCGAELGVWAAHIPLIKAGLALDDSQLGLSLLAMAIGGVASMPVAGLLVHRLGAARASVAAGSIYAAALVAPPLAPNHLLLSVSTFVLGAALGLLAVAMNTHAGAIERAWGRPLLSSIHAFFSVGGLCGAAAGAGLVGLGLGAPAGMALAAAALAAIVAAASQGVVLPGGEPAEADRAFRLPNRAVVGLAALTLCSFVCEGALMDWGAVFLRDVAGAPLALAAAAYGVSSAAMTAGRLCGDRLVARLGPTRTLQVSGGLAFAGFAIIALSPGVAAAYVGLLLAGLGLANVVPTVFSAAGRAPGVTPAAALAMCASFGYGGGLFAPPAIGALSHAFGLRIAFIVLIVAAATIALGASGAIRAPGRLPRG